MIKASIGQRIKEARSLDRLSRRQLADDIRMLDEFAISALPSVIGWYIAKTSREGFSVDFSSGFDSGSIAEAAYNVAIEMMRERELVAHQWSLYNGRAPE